MDCGWYFGGSSYGNFSRLGLSPAVTAGAIISGSYFGDKMSPLSDTTNLAPAVAGTDLYPHKAYDMDNWPKSFNISDHFFVSWFKIYAFWK